MAKYCSTTGSLICNNEQIEIIKETINSYTRRNEEFLLTDDQCKLYLKGWYFPTNQINWSCYAFYGADIQSHAINFIRSQLETIINNLKKKISDEQENKIDGMFYISCEDSNIISLWLIRDSNFTEQIINK